jgi:hypothetical protein
MHATDSAGNVIYELFGPFERDNTPPTTEGKTVYVSECGIVSFTVD